MSRFPATIVIIGLMASHASAQEIDYDAGQYQYPQAGDPAVDDDVVTDTERKDTEQGVAAERVIPLRREGPAPQFVRRPVVQSTAPVGRPFVSAPTASSGASATPQAIAPFVYAYPSKNNIGAGGVHAPGSDPSLVAASPYEMPQGYVMATAPLPAGAQLVAFDRPAWLAACRNRLETYRPEDRSAALAALGGAAMGYREGYDACEVYLDSYLANASSNGKSPGVATPGQAYMLVPVTIAVEAENGPSN